MDIFITTIIVFIATTLWHHWASRKNRLPLRVCLQGMMNDLNAIATKNGYEDITDYWIKEKGSDYAQIAAMNFKGAMDALE